MNQISWKQEGFIHIVLNLRIIWLSLNDFIEQKFEKIYGCSSSPSKLKDVSTYGITLKVLNPGIALFPDECHPQIGWHLWF